MTRVTVSLNMDSLSVLIDTLAAHEPQNGPDAFAYSSGLHSMLDAYSRENARVAARGFTKWDVIHPVERTMLDAIPFGDGTLTCSKCGITLPTEGAFARHYTVNDARYLNLGSCPNG